MAVDLSNQIATAWGKVINWIPEIVGAIVILIIGYFVALGIKALVVAGLKGLGLNRQFFESKGGRYIRKITDDPAELIGSVVYWIMWILIITIALPILNIPVINQLIFGFYAYLPNILASIIILIIAGVVSAGIDTIVDRLFEDSPTGKILKTAAPALILTIATFMVLVQLKIAPSIVIITYAAILGSIALGFALAFGLGGKEVAAKMLAEAYEKGSLHLPRMKSDIERARARERSESENTKQKMEE